MLWLARSQPLLITPRDQVLNLKHQLDTRTISALNQEVVAIEGDIEILVHDMQRSIDEAKTFRDSMG
jgi:hypothetical protein